MPIKALDHLDTGRLIGQHDLAEVFRVELTGEAGGVCQVTEQHRELAALGLRRPRGHAWGGVLGRIVCLADGLRCVLGCWRRWRLGRCRVIRPAQAAPRVIDHLRVRVEEFVLEDRQLFVVEAELEFQCVIGHPAPPLEQGYDLVEDIIKIHGDPSP